MDMFHWDLHNKRTSKINSLRKATNLSRHQKTLLTKLRQSDNFIILMTDKNLSPAIMEREEYIRHILDEHLQDGKGTYIPLTKEQAKIYLLTLPSDLLCLLEEEDVQEMLPKAIKKYFRASLHKSKHHRIPQFYGMPKVHKEMIPQVKFHPVVSQCGSLNAVISTYLDYVLQP